MEKYLRGDLSDSVEIFESQLLDNNTSNETKACLYSNIAAIELGNVSLSMN